MRGPRRWTAVGMAFCALAGAGGASARSLWDDPAFALYRQAVEAIDRKDYERASALAADAITHYPGHLLAHYLIGQAAMARSRWEEAAAAFGNVVRLYPASSAARRELGIAFQQLGRIDEAAEAYTAVLGAQPDEADVRERLAFMLLQAGRQEQALPHLEALADKPTTVPDVWTALARIAYDRGDLAGAEKGYVRALDLRDDGTTWFNLGVVRLRLDDHPGAVKAFQRAAQHPTVREQAQRQLEQLRQAGDAGKRAPKGTPATK
jgi:tetratricopeptide (TPR) repeat protein